MEGGGIVVGLGKVWAAAMGDRQDTIRVGIIPRKIIRYRRLNQSVLMPCMPSSMNYQINTKDLGGLPMMTKHR